MAWYVVSYDLRRDGQSIPLTREHYERVHSALRTAVDYCWPLLSFWMIETPYTPRGVINRLPEMGAINDNDGSVALGSTLKGDFRRLAPHEAIDWLNGTILRG